MKKLALVFGALLVFVAGCGIDDAFKDEPELTTLTGILSEQSTNDSVAGTHLLNDGIADTPIRSLSVNLSSNNYLENRVQVIGFLNQDDGVFEVTGISVVEALHEIEKDPELVEFKNTDFGVQLAVYDNYEVTETDSLIEFTAPDESTFQISQELFQYEPVVTPEGEEEGSAIFDYASKTYVEMDDFASTIRKIGSTPLDALYVDVLGGETYHVYRSGFIYTIELLYSENTESDTRNNFAEMLSEFKFTGFTVEDEDFDTEDAEEDVELDFGDDESDEPLVDETDENMTVPDMKFATFESLPHLFAGKYPASWYYAGSSGNADVIRHYGFNDEPITDNNELISLDVISGDVPAGSTIAGDGKTLTVVQSGSLYTVYTTLEAKTFMISGNPEYKDIMLYMANSLFAIEEE
ncbi:MAG: hypothetical protein ABID64_04210 [Nitrospirota bacterium]